MVPDLVSKSIEMQKVESINILKDCDIILAINTNNGDCYIIPIKDLDQWGETKKLSQLQKYKEKWDIFLK